MLALVGCTGDAEPVETTPAPPTTASSPSPTPPVISAPEQPPLPSSPTPDSAQATAAYFIQLYGYAYASGELSEWDRLSSPSCNYCATTKDDVVRVTSQNHQVTGGSISITAARTDVVQPDVLYSVFLDYEESPSQELDEAGTPVAASDGGSFTALVAVRWTDARWVVEAVDIGNAP